MKNRLLHIYCGDGKGKTFRTAEPHQAVCQTIRIEAGENGDGGKGADGDFEGQNQQRNGGGGVSSEQERHKKEIACLRENADAEKEQDQSGHTGQTRRESDEQKASHQKIGIADKPGHESHEQVPDNQASGIKSRDHGIAVSVCVFQYLVAKKLNGKLVQDVFGQFSFQFDFHIFLLLFQAAGEFLDGIA